MSIKIKLDLTNHCIETALKKSYNQALSSYFKAGSDKKYLEQVIKLAQHALEDFDFAQLRSKYRELAGQTQLQAVLFMDNGSYALSLNRTVIHPIIKA